MLRGIVITIVITFFKIVLVVFLVFVVNKKFRFLILEFFAPRVQVFVEAHACAKTFSNNLRAVDGRAGLSLRGYALLQELIGYQKSTDLVKFGICCC